MPAPTSVSKSAQHDQLSLLIKQADDITPCIQRYASFVGS
jgi:hypothetical protein